MTLLTHSSWLSASGLKPTRNLDRLAGEATAPSAPELLLLLLAREDGRFAAPCQNCLDRANGLDFWCGVHLVGLLKKVGLAHPNGHHPKASPSDFVHPRINLNEVFTNR